MSNNAKDNLIIFAITITVCVVGLFYIIPTWF
jgi:hypothetical protein